MKVRKRPIVVEAHQWFKNGDHPDDACFRPYEDTGDIPKKPREGKVVRYYRTPDLAGNNYCISSVPCERFMREHGWIDTPEGGHIVCPGDWIITGPFGEYYPVKKHIFEATYEIVG